MYTNQCPRCGDVSFEHLSTHSYCYSCNYSPEDDHSLKYWRALEFKKIKKPLDRTYNDPLNIQFYSQHLGIGGVL